MLKTYRTYNLTVGFSKYEFYNKLLDGIVLLRVAPNITCIQLIYIYIYIYEFIQQHMSNIRTDIPGTTIYLFI